MCPRLSANYVSCCPPNMAQVSVWAGNLQPQASSENYGKNHGKHSQGTDSNVNAHRAYQVTDYSQDNRSQIDLPVLSCHRPYPFHKASPFPAGV